MATEELQAKWPLNYWNSQEYADVKAKLDRLEEDGCPYNPSRMDIFRALELIHIDDVRVAIFGQDPYPNPTYATGVAFESPGTEFPATLRTILRERRADLGIENYPSSGSLRRWVYRGVLLWNVTPTIEIDHTPNGWKGYTHKYWKEWPPLTAEIVKALSDRGGRVFAFLGKRAQEYAKYVSIDNYANTVLFFSHPSPIAQQFTNNPFVRSRFFSTINAASVKHGKGPIDWSLD